MAYGQDEKSLKLLIERHQKKVFALALYLAVGDRNKAYEIASDSFAEMLATASPLEDEDALLVRFASAVAEKSRNAKTVISLDDSDFARLAPAKRESLRLIKSVLFKLPFDARLLLLLRDQLHLSYKEISRAISSSEKDARAGIVQARIRLREELEDTLRRKGGAAA